MASFEEDCGTRFLDGIIEEGTSVTKLLSHVDLIPVENHIRTKYYAKNGRKFCFDVGLMIRLVVVKSFRNLSFRKTLYSLTDEDCKYLKVPVIDGKYRIPSSSAFHNFHTDSYRNGVQALFSKKVRLLKTDWAKKDLWRLWNLSEINW